MGSLINAIGEACFKIVFYMGLMVFLFVGGILKLMGSDINPIGATIIVMIVMGVILGLIATIVLIFIVIGHWKAFKKMGEYGWKALIPFYNKWIIVKNSGLNWWWFFFTIPFRYIIVLISILLDLDSRIILLIYMLLEIASNNPYFNLSKKFGKDNGISFISLIFGTFILAYLGFSKTALFNSEVQTSSNGLIDIANNEVTITSLNNMTNQSDWNNVNNQNNDINSQNNYKE